MLEQELDCVWLDLRAIGGQNLRQKFPNIVDNCRRFGIDPLTMPVPVAPAAHYFMGGVMTDTAGRTSVPSLYCIGEVASTGLHGRQSPGQQLLAGSRRHGHEAGAGAGGQRQPVVEQINFVSQRQRAFSRIRFASGAAVAERLSSVNVCPGWLESNRERD